MTPISKDTLEALFDTPAEKLETVKALDVGYDNTNEVYHVTTIHKAEYIIKIQRDTNIHRTQFWKGLNLLFHKTIVDSIQSQKGLTEFLNSLNVIPVPTVIKADPTDHNPIGKPYVIMSKIAGTSVRPESAEALEIAKNKDIAYQLGLFLSKVHTQSFDYFGNPSGEGLPLAEFPNQLASVIQILASAPKALQDLKVQKLLPHYLALARAHPPLQGTGLIMLDLWPIQFLLGQNRLAGLIDLEGYVIGPIGLELSFLEFWLEPLEIFKEGYLSEGAQWPDFEEQRALYRFFLYLLYDCPAMGLEACLEWEAEFPTGDRPKIVL
jgi:Phosphotransferase enzyme family